MRRIKILLLFLAVTLVGCTNKSVSEDIGPSDTYSREEIQETMTVVENQFNDYVSAADLTRLSYDEQESERIVKDYLPTVDLDRLYDSEKTVVLNAKFKTNATSDSLDPTTDDAEYYFILTKKEKWEIIFAGFLN